MHKMYNFYALTQTHTITGRRTHINTFIEMFISVVQCLIHAVRGVKFKNSQFQSTFATPENQRSLNFRFRFDAKKCSPEITQENPLEFEKQPVGLYI